VTLRRDFALSRHNRQRWGFMLQALFGLTE
jgi:hypothetical protein